MLGRMQGRSRHVRAPGGREWTVGIRWLPRHPRWRGLGFGRSRSPRPEGERESAWWEFLDIPDVGGDSLTVWLIVIGVLLAVVLAWVFVFPVLFFLLDLLVLVVIAVVAFALRVLFRRPWIVQATSGDETLTWPVVGWRASQQRVDEVAARIQRGRSLDDLPSPI